MYQPTTYTEEENPEEIAEALPLNGNPTQTQEVKASFCEKFRYGVKNITVEPSLLLCVMSVILASLTTQNLNLDKACRVNLAYSTEICDTLKEQNTTEQNDYEREVQKLVANAMSWKTYISSTIPCVIALFVGAFSDKTGYRKFFMILPIVGQILSSINYMIHTFFFYELRLEHLVFSEAILESITGGWCVLFLTAFSYICAITVDNERTFRIGIANLCLTVGFPIGMSMSGVLLKNVGYYGAFGIVLFLHTLNALYNIFVLKEPKRSKEQRKHDGKGFCYMLRTFFDIKNVQSTLNVVWKHAPNNRRTRLCIILAVVCVLFGPVYGEVSIMYMNTRYRFNWDEIMFSLFQTYNFITHTLGTVFSIALFSKYLGWHDSVLGIIATLSKFASSFVFCFATNEYIFFIAPLVEILSGTSLLALRSIVSKLVEPDEIGKINSVIGLTENLMPLLYVPMYTQVYTATMQVLPGAVFLLGAILTLPAVMVFIWLFYDHRKQLKKTQSLE